MLEFDVHDGEKFVTVQFEHSLLALSKWESKHKKPFLGKTPPTAEELVDYYGCMIITPGVPEIAAYGLSPEQMGELGEYISDSKTASSVREVANAGGVQEPVTSELIYYWLVAMQIDFSVESWHLSRLMMLVRITSFKNNPDKKKDVKGLEQRWAEANERQKKMFGTDG